MFCFPFTFAVIVICYAMGNFNFQSPGESRINRIHHLSENLSVRTVVGDTALHDELMYHFVNYYTVKKNDIEIFLVIINEDAVGHFLATSGQSHPSLEHSVAATAFFTQFYFNLSERCFVP